jgi:hypothetical protein
MGRVGQNGLGGGRLKYWNARENCGEAMECVWWGLCAAMVRNGGN